MSVAEDAAVAGGLALAIANPLVFLVVLLVVVVALVFLIRFILRGLQATISCSQLASRRTAATSLTASSGHAIISQYQPVIHPYRVIDNRSWDDALTGLRGLAASWVLLFHLFGVVGPRAVCSGHLDRVALAAPSGGAGVWVLYTLCGYLLAGPFVTRENSRQVPPIRRYLLRRLAPFFHPMGADIGAVDRGWLGGWADADSSQEMRHTPLLVQNLVLPLSALLPTQCAWTLPVEFDFTCCCHCGFAIVGIPIWRAAPVWQRCGYC